MGNKICPVLSIVDQWIMDSYLTRVKEIVIVTKKEESKEHVLFRKFIRRLDKHLLENYRFTTTSRDYIDSNSSLLTSYTYTMPYLRPKHCIFLVDTSLSSDVNLDIEILSGLFPYFLLVVTPSITGMSVETWFNKKIKNKEINWKSWK